MRACTALFGAGLRDIYWTSPIQITWVRHRWPRKGRQSRMPHLHKVALPAAFVMTMLACNFTSTPAPATATIEPSATAVPSETPSATAAITATVPGLTATAAPSATPGADLGAIPFSNLNNISQYFNPVGQPAQAWNGIPIMPEAIAGQEFAQSGVYSFKADATIEQAVSFYQSRLPALGYTSPMPGAATGSAGTGSNAIHNSVLYMMNGSRLLLLYIASYDSDPNHVSVVISTQ